MEKFRDQSLSFEERAADLVSRMTLEEKLGQLNLLPGGDITTGAAMQSEVGKLTQQGLLGGIFNIKGVRHKPKNLGLITGAPPRQVPGIFQRKTIINKGWWC
jgi:hypothetical protein